MTVSTNLTQMSVLVNTGYAEIWTVVSIILGLGLGLLGGHLFFCLKQRKEINEIIKSFKGNPFITKLKKELSYNYLLGAKAVNFFVIVSFSSYAISLIQLFSIFAQEKSYTLNQIGTWILITLAFTLIAVFIAIILYNKKDKLKEYGKIVEIDDIQNIPKKLKEDIKKLKDRFGLLQLSDENLKDKIIEAVADAINRGED